MRASHTRRIRSAARPVKPTAIIVLGLLCPPVQGSSTTVSGRIPSYTEAPVFYDHAWEYYGDKANLTLVHEGKVKLGSVWIAPITDFSWSAPGQTVSYWVAMESFRYLLPLVGSDEPRDQEFVHEWIRGWLDAHDPSAAMPNAGAVDAMSVAKRAMTFIWHLKRLQEREESGGEYNKKWAARVEASLLWHQTYLKDHYGTRSNHGFWAAMGLFETTRVHPDSSLTRLALDRLAEMTRLSVSDRGLHVERSPAYHFYVWNWLKQYVAYFNAMDEIEWSGLPALVNAEQRMRDATYYLYDHRKNLPQIGDTDAKVLSKTDLPVEKESTRDPVMYDPQAGYAIYKDGEHYVVFGIQNQEHPIWMPYHCHDDVLSVYYSMGGEIILGDQGRHSYERGTPIRQYFLSNAAHNTAVPTRSLGKRAGIELADEVSWLRDGDRDVFRATRAASTVTRAVNVSRRSSSIRVVDSIVADEDYTILWHMGPDVSAISPTPTSSKKGVERHAWELVTRGGRKLQLTITLYSAQGARVRIAEGEKDPYLGWYSSGRLVETPSKVIVIDLPAHRQADVETRLTRIEVGR